MTFDMLMLHQALLFTSPLDTAEARTKLTQDELNITELFRENTPSVVFITNMASRSAWRPAIWIECYIISKHECIDRPTVHV